MTGDGFSLDCYWIVEALAGKLVWELLGNFLRRTQLRDENGALSTFPDAESGSTWHGVTVLTVFLYM